MAIMASETHRLLTIEEFDRAWRAGVYGPDEKLELIEGEVFCKMSPQESGHSTGIRAAEEELRRVFRHGHDVRVQMPLEFGSLSKPEPDIAVVAGSFRDFAKRQPTAAALVVEVSDSTIEFDRSVKAAVYARAGIEEYWIVNLRERVVEVYREPVSKNDGPIEYRYRIITRCTETETVSPLAASNSIIRVSDLLP